MLVGQILTEIVPTFLDNDRRDDIKMEAQRLLTPILECVSPEMDTFFWANTRSLGEAARELHSMLQPLFDEWINKGLWLVWDTPEFRAHSASDEHRQETEA
jgi:hypothetical protein